MPAILLPGTAGRGKTHAAIETIVQTLRAKQFARIWVLLPSEPQIAAFRDLMMARLDGAPCFGVEYFNFYTLYERLLEMAGVPQRSVDTAARRRILQQLIAERRDELRHFVAIAHLPGFIVRVDQFIQELKQAQVAPEALALADSSPKGADLALIYAAYQKYFQDNNLADRDGEGWLALAMLREITTLAQSIDLLVIDGFDQFDLVQTRLINLLAERARDTLLTLTYSAERAQTAHRRFAQTRERLLREAPDGLWTERNHQPHRQIVSPDLRSLEVLAGQIFELNPVQVDNDGGLRLIEVPDRRREVGAILRAVKRLLLDGVSPEQIAILVRDLTPYAPYFLELARAYGVPLASRHGPPLAENPAIVAILGLIDLAEAGFPRRALLESLSSVYFDPPGLTRDQIAALDRLSRDQIIIGGCEDWLTGIRLAMIATSIDPESELPTIGESAQPDPAILALEPILAAIFNRLTPPESATARDFVRWIEALIGPDPARTRLDPELEDEESERSHFNLIARLRAQSRLTFARDMRALARFKQALGEVLSAYELVDAATILTWTQFRRDLQIAIDGAPIDPPRAGRSGRVLLANVYDARGLHHDHLFVLGMAEGEFPSRTPEDAFYTDSERLGLQSAGVALTTRLEQTDQSALFYEITARARKTLTLSRPYLDEKGNPWPASPFWRAVTDVVQVTPERLRIAATVEAQDVTRPMEAMQAVAGKLNGRTSQIDPLARQIWGWLESHPTLHTRWHNALTGRAIELRRDHSRNPHDRFSGRLQDPPLIAHAATRLGPDHPWSASQLNDFGICPYRFFSRRFLGLEALKDPEEGMDALQRGTLIHAILERTYKAVSKAGLALSAENCDAALAEFDRIAPEVLDNAPTSYGFRPSPLWARLRQIMLRRLRQLIMQDFSEDSLIGRMVNGASRYAKAQEQSFDDRGAMLPGSPDTGPIRVRGQIDRVDQSDGGVIVVDYKTGSGDHNLDDLAAGRDLQMLIYRRAASVLFSDQPVQAAGYLMVDTLTLKGKILNGDSKGESALNAAEEILYENIAMARRGIFANKPSDPHGRSCRGRCEFSALCRLTRASTRKPVE